MKTKTVGLVEMICTFLPLMLSAQTSVNIPNNTQNTRFFADILNVKRPALSVDGFHNNGDHSHGYGLNSMERA